MKNELEKVKEEIKNSVNDVLETGYIDDKIADKILRSNKIYNEINSQKEDLSYDEKIINNRIKKEFEKLDLFFEESVRIFNEEYEKALNDGSHNTGTLNQLKFLASNIEKVVKANNGKEDNKKEILEDIETKLQTIYNMTFFFNR